MARRNSKETRIDAMSQRDIRKLERKKKNKNPRNDAKDWTDSLYQRLKEVRTDES